MFPSVLTLQQRVLPTTLTSLVITLLTPPIFKFNPALLTRRFMPAWSTVLSKIIA